MTFRIHYTLPDGSEDSITIEGDTLDDIRSRAALEVTRRNGRDPWSEEIEGR